MAYNNHTRYITKNYLFPPRYTKGQHLQRYIEAAGRADRGFYLEPLDVEGYIGALNLIEIGYHLLQPCPFEEELYRGNDIAGVSGGRQGFHLLDPLPQPCLLG